MALTTASHSGELRRIHQYIMMRASNLGPCLLTQLGQVPVEQREAMGCEGATCRQSQLGHQQGQALRADG